MKHLLSSLLLHLRQSLAIILCVSFMLTSWNRPLTFNSHLSTSADEFQSQALVGQEILFKLIKPAHNIFKLILRPLDNASHQSTAIGIQGSVHVSENHLKTGAMLLEEVTAQALATGALLDAHTGFGVRTFIARIVERLNRHPNPLIRQDLLAELHEGRLTQEHVLYLIGGQVGEERVEEWVTPTGQHLTAPFVYFDDEGSDAQGALLWELLVRQSEQPGALGVIFEVQAAQGKRERRAYMPRTVRDRAAHIVIGDDPLNPGQPITLLEYYIRHEMGEIHYRSHERTIREQGGIALYNQAVVAAQALFQEGNSILDDLETLSAEVITGTDHTSQSNIFIPTIGDTGSRFILSRVFAKPNPTAEVQLSIHNTLAYLLNPESDTLEILVPYIRQALTEPALYLGLMQQLRVIAGNDQDPRAARARETIHWVRAEAEAHLRQFLYPAGTSQDNDILDALGVNAYEMWYPLATAILMDDFHSLDVNIRFMVSSRAGNIDLHSDFLALHLRSLLHHPLLGPQALALMVHIAAIPGNQGHCIRQLAAAVASPGLSMPRVQKVAQSTISNPAQRDYFIRHLRHIAEGYAEIVNQSGGRKQRFPRTEESLFQSFLRTGDPEEAIRIAQNSDLMDAYCLRLSEIAYSRREQDIGKKHHAQHLIVLLYETNSRVFQNRPYEKMLNWIVGYISLSHREFVLEQITWEDLRSDQPARLLGQALRNPEFKDYKDEILGMMIAIAQRSPRDAMYQELVRAIVHGHLGTTGTLQERISQGLDCVSRIALNVFEGVNGSPEASARLFMVSISRNWHSPWVSDVKVQSAYQDSDFTSTGLSLTKFRIRARINRSIQLMTEEMKIHIPSLIQVRQNALDFLERQDSEMPISEVLDAHASIIDRATFENAYTTANTDQRAHLLQVLTDMVVFYQTGLQLPDDDQRYLIQWLPQFLAMRGAMIDPGYDWSQAIRPSPRPGLEGYIKGIAVFPGEGTHIKGKNEVRDRSIQSAALDFLEKSANPRSGGPLIVMMNDMYSGVHRGEAASAIGMTKDLMMVDPLIRRMEDGVEHAVALPANSPEKQRAKQQLSTVPNLQALERTIELLRSGQILGVIDPIPGVLDHQNLSLHAVRREAAIAIGNLGNPGGIPALVTALQNPFSRGDDEWAPQIIEAQLDSLEKLGYPTGSLATEVNRLLESKNSNDILGALYFLAKKEQEFDSTSFIPLIVPLLANHNISVRRFAGQTLSKYGYQSNSAYLHAQINSGMRWMQINAEMQDAIPALELALGHLETSHFDRHQIAKALQKLGWNPENASIQLQVYYYIALQQWDQLPLLGSIAIAPLLFELVHQHKIGNDVEPILRTLGQISDPIAVLYLNAVRGDLKAELGQRIEMAINAMDPSGQIRAAEQQRLQANRAPGIKPKFPKINLRKPRTQKNDQSPEPTREESSEKPTDEESLTAQDDQNTQNQYPSQQEPEQVIQQSNGINSDVVKSNAIWRAVMAGDWEGLFAAIKVLLHLETGINSMEQDLISADPDFQISFQRLSWWHGGHFVRASGNQIILNSRYSYYELQKILDHEIFEHQHEQERLKVEAEYSPLIPTVVRSLFGELWIAQQERRRLDSGNDKKAFVIFARLTAA